MKYQAAKIGYLDRQTGLVRTSVHYPITSVELLVVENGVVGQVAYEVRDDGHWHQIPATTDHHPTEEELDEAVRIVKSGGLKVMSPEEMNGEPDRKI